MKPIPDWPYVAHVDGSIHSVDRWVNFSDGRKRFYEGKRLAVYTDDFGYLKVTLKRNGESWRVHVHVLVALAFHGKRPKKLQVCHSDGDHLNNTPGNLRYDTCAGNAADTKKHGRQRPKCRLSKRQIDAIRRLRGKVPGTELAARFGTSKAHVCNIQMGRRRTER